MSYQDILVYLNDETKNELLLQTVSDLAARFDSRITGLFVRMPMQYYGYPGIHVPPVVIDGYSERTVAAENRAQKLFSEEILKPGIEGEFVTVDGFPAREICKQSICSDLVVLCQGDSAGPWSDQTGLIGEVVIEAPKPVLVVPYVGFLHPPGRRVMVAWNGSEQAARAVSDALPFLKNADIVHLLNVDPAEADGDVPFAEICNHLARHGVTVEGSTHHSGDVEVAATLESRAADLSSDLIVLGAYGHTRFMESVFGGVTRQLLESTPVPLLMSH